MSSKFILQIYTLFLCGCIRRISSNNFPGRIKTHFHSTNNSMNGKWLFILDGPLFAFALLKFYILLYYGDRGEEGVDKSVRVSPVTYTGDVFVSAGCECNSSKQYYVSATSFTFINALAYCQSLQAALVEVETLQEQLFLNGILMAAVTKGISPGQFWVGLEYTPTGIFFWKLNSSVVLPNLWLPGDPNGNWINGETCVRYINRNGIFSLADNICTNLYNVICERPMTSGVCECPNTTSSAITASAGTGTTCNGAVSTSTASTTTTVLITTQGFQAPTSTDINTQQLIADMTVNAKSTGKSKRKLISVEDKRFSAQMIGVVGVCCLVIVFILPLLIDLLTFFNRKCTAAKRV